MVVENEGISYNLDSDTFISGVDIFDFARYLKGRYSNSARCKARLLDYFYEAVEAYDKPHLKYSLDLLLNYVDKATPYSYKEAFQISDNSFKALVFGSINIPEMIKNLGHERVSVEGKEVRHRKYKEDGSYDMVDYTVVYELHKVNGKALDIDDSYAVKCWCTTTEEEHWLWVESSYADKGALEAIASTCRVYQDMIPFIVSIKRQGDVFLFEMSETVKPKGPIVPLTADQYFGLLVAQS